MDSITKRIAFVFERDNQSLHDVPTPTAMWLMSGAKSGFIVAYDLWGNFGTNKSAKYLNDAVLRYMMTYGCQFTKVVPITTPDCDNECRYDLSEIAKGLKSLKARSSTFSETKRVYTGKEDRLFWIAKEFCEMSLRRQQIFTEFDIKQVILLAGGTYSQSKAKAKAIYNWYYDNNFKPSKRVFEMSRSEHMKKVNAERKAKAKAAILNVAMSFRFLNQKMTAKAVGQAAKLDQRTASKYIKELKLEGLL